MKDIKDMVQTYTNTMSFSGRQKLRKLIVRTSGLCNPKTEEILPILKKP